MAQDEYIFIVRCGEVALKGMNKPYFERMLLERIKKLLKKFDGVRAYRHEGLIYVRAEKVPGGEGQAPADPAAMKARKDAIIREIGKVFGVASISPAMECESTMEDIGRTAVEYMMEAIEERGVKTFKVEAKRADKNFPVKSPDIARQIGAAVLKGCKVLRVDVHDPDVRLFVDVRHDKSYVYQDKIPGFGGLPLGTNGKGMTLLSGGIDSPVPGGDVLRKVSDARDQPAADPGADRDQLSRRGDDDSGAAVHDANRRRTCESQRLQYAHYRRKPRPGSEPDGRGAGGHRCKRADAGHAPAHWDGQGGHHGSGPGDRDLREIHRAV